MVISPGEYPCLSIKSYTKKNLISILKKPNTFSNFFFKPKVSMKIKLKSKNLKKAK